MEISDCNRFYGKLDECLVTEGGELIPLDFKTASTDPREKAILPAYESQIDDYLFLLEHNRRSTAGYGYLIFFFPDTSDSLHERFPFVVEIKKVTGHPAESAHKGLRTQSGGYATGLSIRRKSCSAIRRFSGG